MALRALFSQPDGDEVLKALGFFYGKKENTGEVKHLDSFIDESRMTKLLLKEDKGDYSIDQLIMTGQVVLSKWMTPDIHCLPLQFCLSDSVFNVLLNFSADTLLIKDGEPICRYNKLLRWHMLTSQLGEDLFTTSYLAASDIKNKSKRHFLDWPVYIGHDCKELNALFEKPMAELHMHLKGSSYNSDISWMCLMNHIDRMRGIFDDVAHERKDTEWDNQLFRKVRNAATIRYYLAGVVGCFQSDITKSQLWDCLNEGVAGIKNIEYNESHENDPIYLFDLLKHIDDKHIEGSDYIPVEHCDKDKIANLVLSSERQFMYNVFRYIYGDGRDPDVGSLFYAYLLYKDDFRHAILQLNNRVGFANFSTYEELKSRFILPEYTELLYKAAIDGFLSTGKRRYVEARITPKDTKEDIAKSLCQIYDSITRKKWCKIIFHFIKKRDESYKENDAIRNRDLREEVKRQAIAIYKFRQSDDKNVGAVVGIDAANSEIYARPEVFAQAFRFLRGHEMQIIGKERPNDLNITYHVGEDFLDLADGLRAVEEALVFLGMKNGDRLGHALALGTDVRSYYLRRHDTICETKLVILDNLAWLYHKCVKLMGFCPLCGYLEEQFHHYFWAVYGDGKEDSCNPKDIYTEKDNEIKELDDIKDYYQAWLLRGNAPDFGKEVDPEAVAKRTDPIEIQWADAGINHHRGVDIAIRNHNARELFDMYHSRNLAKKDSAVDTFTIRASYREEYYQLLEKIQDNLLDKIERKHIAIECNPSSNYKIGDMERYDQHPIVKFFNYGLDTPYKERNISVSINTDDQGIFSTSLEREYSLMALALERNELQGHRNSPRAIVEWLDNIREMSMEHKFDN